MIKWNRHTATPLRIPIVLQADLKIFRKPMIETGSKELQVCGSICAVMQFAVLTMYMKTVLSYFIDMSAKQSVR